MRTDSRSGLGRFRRVPLAAQLVAMFALADASACFAATTWTVTSCSNANTGSGNAGTLRYGLTHASDGDTVDMTGLVCSTISFGETGTNPGSMYTNSGTITVLGPGRDKLTIAGVGVDRIFYGIPGVHITTLVLEDLTLSHGYAAYDFLLQKPHDGGCINLFGSVTLNRVTLTDCSASGGGGAVSAGGVTLDHATVTNNKATVGGGGIYASGVTLTSSVVTMNQTAGNGGGIRGNNVSLTDSTVSYNMAGVGASYQQGGGIFVTGNITLTRSTIDHNTVYGGSGGVITYSLSPASLTATIIDSTISNNLATVAIGGIYANSGLVKVYNSTIAFNRAGVGKLAAGMATGDLYGAIDVRFHSALITNNFGANTPHDFSFLDGPGAGQTASFSGTNNFVRFPDYTPGSAFTHVGGCPRLGPLRNNGGPTRTHALLSGSQAINVGDNVNGLPNDQRGAPFSRAVGVTDIGAYEVQPEVVFNAGFDDC